MCDLNGCHSSQTELRKVSHMITDKTIMLTLSNWGRVTHLCVSISWQHHASENDILPIQHQAFIWTNMDLVLTLPWGTDVCHTLNKNTTVFIEAYAFRDSLHHVGNTILHYRTAFPLCKVQCHADKRHDPLNSKAKPHVCCIFSMILHVAPSIKTTTPPVEWSPSWVAGWSIMENMQQ